MPTRPPARDAAVRRRMQRQKRMDTTAELELRRALHAMGKRYRVGYPVPGMSRRSIDVAFPGPKVAVFVDGCFWHGCPEHYIPPKTNAAWWAEKIAANADRDRQTEGQLRSQGWTVVRLWEHVAPEDMVRIIEIALRERGRPRGSQ